MTTLTKEQIYCEMQKEWVKLTGAKVGDIVRVTRNWQKGEQGFAYCGVSSIDKGELRILKICDNSIDLEDQNGYPYFALEFVGSAPKEVTIGGERIVRKEENLIVCGCCKLTKAQAAEAVKNFESLSSIFSKYEFSIYIEGSEISRSMIEQIKELL